MTDALLLPRGRAEFSPCRRYRYLLTRGPGADRPCVFLMLNPSTADAAATVVCAWGAGGSYLNRATTTLALLRDHNVKPMCLRITKGGQPEHPLYLPGVLQPIPYRP